MKNIKVYDIDELGFIYIPLTEAQEYYKMNKDEYESLEEFLHIYAISPKHKKHFLEKRDK